MKELIKVPEKIQLSNPNLSDTEFKTLRIWMLRELAEYSHKIEKKVKVMKSEIKGTNSEGKETRTQINSVE